MVIDPYSYRWNDSFRTFHLLFIGRLFTKGNERFSLHEAWGWPKGKEWTRLSIINGKTLMEIGRESIFEVIGYRNSYGYNKYKRETFPGDLFNL